MPNLNGGLGKSTLKVEDESMISREFVIIRDSVITRDSEVIMF